MNFLPCLAILAGVASLAMLGLLGLRMRKRNLRRRLHAKDIQRAAQFRNDREEFQLQVRNTKTDHTTAVIPGANGKRKRTNA